MLMGPAKEKHMSWHKCDACRWVFLKLGISPGGFLFGFLLKPKSLFISIFVHFLAQADAEEELGEQYVQAGQAR